MSKKSYKYILFDLDGTLVDSAEGITRSVEYSLEHFGIYPADRDELTCFIGPPLIDSFMRYCGFGREKAGEAVDVYRRRYATVGVHENRAYPGITELLRKLTDDGRICCVATSKPEVFANIVVDDMGYRPYIKHVFGAELDDAEGRKHKQRLEKAEVIAYALESLGIKDKAEVLMVGDRRHDIEGARANGIDSCGVLFGFGSKEELETAGATYIAETPEAISELVI